MRISELFEESSKKVAFCFGRMNPPTIGHGKLLDTLAQSDGDYLIFLSQTQDSKKNPLDYSTKLKFIKAMFPEHAKHIIEDASLNTIMKVAAYLYSRGYRDVTLVAGSDRIEELSKLLNAYNGVEGKAHGFYKFDNIDAVSSGEREDGADGVAGVSASDARAAAAAGDFEKFAEATGSKNLAQSLYNAVRAGMNISQDSIKTENSEDDEYAQQIARSFIQRAKLGRHNADEGTIMRMLSKFFEKFGISDYYFNSVYHKISAIVDQPTESITREATMKAKDFIPPSKPRNPVVRQQQTSGAGTHKDKKKAQKQGDIKHKGKMFSENAEELNVGDPVIITGKVQFQGKTGDIDSFGKDKRFVVVNLYNYGKQSFHSSDVEYNDYADQDVEEVSKPTLARYVKAAGKDVEQRASSQSFASGKAGDKYNKADTTHKDTQREKGIDRALSRLSK
jgi:hypothetical protein